MSLALINLSPDLKKLRDEGYDIAIKGGHLVVRDVPYVNAACEIKYGVLVSKLTLANDVTALPQDHIMFFAGEFPCHRDGTPIKSIEHQARRQQLDPGLFVDISFSSKPDEGYPNYYEKVTTYAAILGGPARAIDPKVTAKTFPVIEAEEEDSVFRYVDTASSRAEINVIVKKLEKLKIAIIGIGGTGVYTLDFVAKTHVKEIHLFDGDLFLQHNAFRAPGAASREELKEKLAKGTYWQRVYSEMRRDIIAHPYHVEAHNVDELRGMDFVFLCMDRGAAKKVIIEKLEQFGISFIDVGMGINETEGALGGILRVTTSTPEKRDHVAKRISFSDNEGNNEYDRNIQTAELNAMNATLAVIKWKKLYGVYLDLDREHSTTYTIDGGFLLNEDKT